MTDEKDIKISIGDLFLFGNKELYYVVDDKRYISPDFYYTLILLNPDRPDRIRKRYMTHKQISDSLKRTDDMWKHHPVK
jgi:hypothetical protein